MDEHHHDRLAKLEAVVESLAGNMGRLTDDIQRIAESAATRSQTNWGNIFAGITLVVILVTGYVGLPLNALQKAFDEHREAQKLALEEMVENARRDDGRLEDRFNRHQQAFIEDLDVMHNEVQALNDRAARDEERMHAIERELFRGGNYKSGRPILPEDTRKNDRD